MGHKVPKVGYRVPKVGTGSPGVAIGSLRWHSVTGGPSMGALWWHWVFRLVLGPWGDMGLWHTGSLRGLWGTWVAAGGPWGGREVPKGGSRGSPEWRLVSLAWQRGVPKAGRGVSARWQQVVPRVAAEGPQGGS